MFEQKLHQNSVHASVMKVETSICGHSELSKLNYAVFTTNYKCLKGLPQFDASKVNTCTSRSYRSYVHKELLKSRYQLDTDNTPLVTENVTHEDANVIHYAAGYVCRKVEAKNIKSSFKNKHRVKICLFM